MVLMSKRILLVLSLGVALVVVAEPLQTVHSIMSIEAQVLTQNSTPTSISEDSSKQKEGSSILRVFKAPFKAMGRLFGRGQKSEDKLQRITDEDLAKFESHQVQVSRSARPKAAERTASSSEKAPSSEEVDPLKQASAEYLNKGRALLASGDFNKAISELSRAAFLDPTSGAANTLLGMAYERKGLRHLALRSFEAAVRIDKDQPYYLNNLGYLLLQNGDYEEATKYLKRAAKLAPDNPGIWNNLGLAQAQRGKFDDAYKSFERAQGKFKGLLNISVRLEAAGQSEKAIKQLEKAKALQPDSQEVLARLIVLYEKAGQPEEAQAARGVLLTLRTLANAPTQ